LAALSDCLPTLLVALISEIAAAVLAGFEIG
jgi:hypothetical protein